MTAIQPLQVSQQEAAKLLGYSVPFLRRLKPESGGPPVIRVGRTVRYAVADLLAWMDSKKVKA